MTIKINNQRENIYNSYSAYICLIYDIFAKLVEKIWNKNCVQ